MSKPKTQGDIYSKLTPAPKTNVSPAKSTIIKRGYGQDSIKKLPK